MVEWKNRLLGVGIGLLVGLCLGGLLLFAAAQLLRSRQLSPVAMQVAASLPAALGALAGGWAAGLKTRGQGLLNGALCGTGVFLAFCLAAVCLWGWNAGPGLFIKGAACLLCGGAGGLLGRGNGNRIKI